MRNRQPAPRYKNLKLAALEGRDHPPVQDLRKWETSRLSRLPCADSTSITSSSSADNIAAWLDARLAGPASAVIAPDDDTQTRLGETPFDAVISAIDRARASLTDAAQAAF